MSAPAPELVLCVSRTVPFYDSIRWGVVWHGNLPPLPRRGPAGPVRSRGARPVPPRRADGSFVFPIVRSSVKHVAPLRLRDRFEVYARVVDARLKSAGVRGAARRRSRVCARARSEQVAVRLPELALDSASLRGRPAGYAPCRRTELGRGHGAARGVTATPELAGLLDAINVFPARRRHPAEPGASFAPLERALPSAAALAQALLWSALGNSGTSASGFSRHASSRPPGRWSSASRGVSGGRAQRWRRHGPDQAHRARAAVPGERAHGIDPAGSSR
jgi:acyl-CoA thioester hydrolase